MEWVDYVDRDHVAVAAIAAWLNTLPPFARDHERGKVDDLMEAAAYGELMDSGDALTPIKPIRADPEIFEIRHRALKMNLRFYHGEPAELPDALVAVHEHVKTSDADQEAQLQHAAERYNEGRDSIWGTDNL